MAKLKNMNHIIIGKTDKGLGPFAIEFVRYIEDGLRLLSSPKHYQFLTPQEATNRAQHVQVSIFRWIMQHRKFLTDMEAKYIRKGTAKASDDPFGHLYLMYKVHKDPVIIDEKLCWKPRPVVSDCASVTNALSKWVDTMLQPMMQGLQTYFKDSFAFKAKLDTFVVPPRGRLFTCDAEGMYPNIETDIAMTSIAAFLRDEATQKQYPHYNANALIAALEIVFRNNVMQFGDTHWDQISGTSMGKPPAPPFASLFEGINEKKYLATYKANLPLYNRFIDDGIGCWVPLDHHNTADDDAQFTNFEEAVNSNCLTWIFTERSMSVDFMDMTLTIVGSKIATTLYEKPTALHLYIPPHSSHPPGCVKGHIYGETIRINRLCSSQEDIHNRMLTFFRRLRQRGYPPSFLIPQFEKALVKAAQFTACSEAQRAAKKRAQLEASRRRVYFHVDWHPQGPRAREIQQQFDSCVLTPPGKTPFNKLGFGGSDIPLDAMIIANHRTQNLGDKFSYRKLQKRDGPSVSSLMK